MLHQPLHAGLGVGGEFGPYRQSEGNILYKKYAEKLLKSDYVYRRFCSDEVVNYWFLYPRCLLFEWITEIKITGDFSYRNPNKWRELQNWSSFRQYILENGLLQQSKKWRRNRQKAPLHLPILCAKGRHFKNWWSLLWWSKFIFSNLLICIIFIDWAACICSFLIYLNFTVFFLALFVNCLIVWWR